jgi:hypothetical protein
MGYTIACKHISKGFILGREHFIMRLPWKFLRKE